MKKNIDTPFLTFTDAGLEPPPPLPASAAVIWTAPYSGSPNNSGGLNYSLAEKSTTPPNYCAPPELLAK